MRFIKTGKTSTNWASMRDETQFGSNFGAKMSLPCPFFS
jgi:hypothetical protein